MSSVLFISPEQYFSELLIEACNYKNLRIPAASQTYILNLLNHYIDSRNLFEPFIDETTERPPDSFAELYLTALNSEVPRNRELMKILADRALYLSGFFSDSLQRRAVDLDYYMSIGAAAYSNLSSWTKEQRTAHIYSLFAEKFFDYAELLGYISEKSQIQSDPNILRLYERYIQTGSTLARDKLTELGVVTQSKEQLKLKKI